MTKKAHIQPLTLFLMVLTPSITIPSNQDRAERAIGELKKELPHVRLTEKDWKLSPGWPLPQTIPAVEGFFRNPWDVTRHGTQWADQIENATSLKPVFELAKTILKSTHSSLSPNPHIKRLPIQPSSIPKDLAPLLDEFYLALAKADHHLKQAVQSVPEENRHGFLSLYEWPSKETGKIVDEISSRVIKRKYEGMKNFNQEELLQAAALLVSASHDFHDKFTSLEGVDVPAPIQWTTPLGIIMISGTKDDVYENNDLENVVLLIDLGGNNSYTTAVAAALEGQIRMVLDYGRDVGIKMAQGTGPNAGAGIFGIGMLFMLNGEGTKLCEVASYGQGCGIGGVGVLYSRGRLVLKGLRYVQGAGVYGVGILKSERGHKSSYWAERNGQGLGMIRGVGIFSHQGDDSEIMGGLVQADPREPQGSVSLCQGVGFGRRAYSGGGIGIAVTKGDRLHVEGSYFSQGSGYWHAFGLFRHNGNKSTIQSRRYDMGCGVHSAFGHFQIFGNQNRILNWGTGPTHGWDASAGSALLMGNENEIQSQWGAGNAAINSLAYSFFEGDKNKFKSTAYGRGRYFRNSLSYSIHVFKGKGNLYEQGSILDGLDEPFRLQLNPWGTIRFDELDIEGDLKLEPPVWHQLPQEKVLARQKLNLNKTIQLSLQKETKEKIADLLDVASAFSLDKSSPKKALKKILSIDEAEVPELVDLVEPMATDQLIRLNLILPAFGSQTAMALMKKWETFEPHKRTVLLNLARNHDPVLLIPWLFKIIERDDSPKHGKTYRISSISTIGQMLSKDSGKEPGFRALLLAAQNYYTGKNKKKSKQELYDQLTRIRPPLAYAFISSVLGENQKRRLALLETLGDDITDTIKEPGAKEILKQLKQDKKSGSKKVSELLTFLNQVEADLRPILFTVLKSTDTRELGTALSMLGRIAHPEDAPLFEPFVRHESGRIRAITSVALGRMGEAVLPFLLNIMDTGQEEEKLAVIASLPHATSSLSRRVLRKGLKDSSPKVRLLTVSCVLHINLAPALVPHKKQFTSMIKKIRKKETDPSVRLAMSYIQ